MALNLSSGIKCGDTVNVAFVAHLHPYGLSCEMCKGLSSEAQPDGLIGHEP